MKGVIAVVLCLLGILLIGGSYLWTRFTTPQANEEWVETHGDRYTELASDLHKQLSGQRTESSFEDTKEEYKKIQMDLKSVKDAHQRTATIMWFSGLAIALVGVGFGLWARAEQPD